MEFPVRQNGDERPLVSYYGAMQPERSEAEKALSEGMRAHLDRQRAEAQFRYRANPELYDTLRRIEKKLDELLAVSK